MRINSICKALTDAQWNVLSPRWPTSEIGPFAVSWIPRYNSLVFPSSSYSSFLPTLFPRFFRLFLRFPPFLSFILLFLPLPFLSPFLFLYSFPLSISHPQSPPFLAFLLLSPFLQLSLFLYFLFSSISFLSSSSLLSSITLSSSISFLLFSPFLNYFPPSFSFPPSLSIRFLSFPPTPCFPPSLSLAPRQMGFVSLGAKSLPPLPISFQCHWCQWRVSTFNARLGISFLHVTSLSEEEGRKRERERGERNRKGGNEGNKDEMGGRESSQVWYQVERWGCYMARRVDVDSLTLNSGSDKISALHMGIVY